MRFRKGSKVEVLTRKDLPCGAWRVGEIVSGNGHTYGVSYGCASGVTSDDAVGFRVTRKDLRPIPPPLVGGGQGHWAPGDLVEAFDLISWKVALVLKVFDGDWYLVRLLGSLEKLKLNIVNIRARQLWHDGNWIVMGKGCANSGEVQLQSSKFTPLGCSRKFICAGPQSDAKKGMESGESCLALEKNAYFQESHVVPARTLKRKSRCGLSDLEENRKSHKKSAIKNKDECQRCPSSWINNIDAVAYPLKYLGETFMHSSPIDHGVEFYGSGRDSPGNDVEHFNTRCLESDDSDICSVASCSVNCDNYSEPSDHVLGCSNHDADVLSSDAESVCGNGEEEGCHSHLLEEDVAPRTHRLELYAYRSTLEGYYASGPLSWEQEALLTNLRISLNVSNDEHLMMLRDLSSTRSTKILHLR